LVQEAIKEIKCGELDMFYNDNGRMYILSKLPSGVILDFLDYII
jgi:hypothetical protein